jgi:hypothetical protein
MHNFGADFGVFDFFVGFFFLLAAAVVFLPKNLRA